MTTCRVQAQLGSLRRGSIFWLDGQRGKLLYSNECRAHVQLDPRQVEVKGVKFERTVVGDWSPRTVVEIEVKRKDAFDDL